MQCARQNPYEFFLHEYVNFVHGTEKPYRSLSIKIYIFMQCAPKSFSRISRLDSMAKCVDTKCVDIDTFGHAVKSTQISHLQPVCVAGVTTVAPVASHGVELSVGRLCE